MARMGPSVLLLFAPNLLFSLWIFLEFDDTSTRGLYSDRFVNVGNNVQLVE